MVIASMAMKALPKSNNKICAECKTNLCASGEALPVPNKPGRQRYICNKCIAGVRSLVVREALKIGQLSAPRVLAAQHGTQCPASCVRVASGHCLAARRAILRAADD